METRLVAVNELINLEQAGHAAEINEVETHRRRRFVAAVEQRALRWVELPEGGAQLHGAPVVLRLSRPIPDLALFVDQLFSAREPFRLWGIPQMIDELAVEVEAVDLHVGQQLRFDIAPDWLRVYLFASGCGNTVARLVSNLQRHFDGALSIVDVELNAELTVDGGERRGDAPGAGHRAELRRA